MGRGHFSPLSSPHGLVQVSVAVVVPGNHPSLHPLEEEIRFLLDTGRLTICPEDEKRYFNAYLCGTLESRSRDGIVAFYDVKRENGAITDVNFYLIERNYFEENYRFCGPNG